MPHWQIDPFWLRIAIGVAVALAWLWFALSGINQIRNRFARQIGLERRLADRLYNLPLSPAKVLNWVAALPMLVIVLSVIPLVLVPSPGGLELWFKVVPFTVPFAFGGFGLSAWLMPVDDMTYRRRLKTLKPGDVTADNIAEVKARLLAMPDPHAFSTRVIGLIMIIGAVLSIAVLFRVSAFIDKFHVPCPHCSTR